MDKREFHRRLERAGKRVLHVAQTWVIEELPTSLLYNLPPYDDPQGSRGPSGTVKFFGGRFLMPEDLLLLSSRRAADLLWVDGRVPGWVDISVVGINANSTVLGLQCQARLEPADETRLGQDLHEYVDKNDPVEPFRTRGLSLPGLIQNISGTEKFSIGKIMALRGGGGLGVVTLISKARPK